VGEFIEKRVTSSDILFRLSKWHVNSEPNLRLLKENTPPLILGKAKKKSALIPSGVIFEGEPGAGYLYAFR